MINKILTILFSTYLILLPFGQLLRVPTPYPGLVIHPTDLIIGLIFSVWLTLRMVPNLRKGLHFKTDHREGSEPFARSPIGKPIAVFILIALASLLKDAFTAPLTETIISSFYLLRWVAYASLFPVTLRLTNHKKISDYLFLAFTLITLFGLIQYLFLPDLKSLTKQGWDPHYYRLTGTELDPGFSGILLLIGLIYIWGAIPSFTKSAITYYLLPVTYLAIALTYSRATYLSTIASALTYSCFKKTWKFFLAATTIFILTWFLLPRPQGAGGDLSRTSTVKFRLNNYQQTLQIFIDHPTLGAGFNRLRYVKKDYGYLNQAEWQNLHSGAGSDNSFLFILATTGLLGFTAYLWLWYAILKSIWPKTTKPSNYQINRFLSTIHLFKPVDPRLPVANYLLPITFISILVHSQFNNTLFYPPVMALTWIFLALSFRSKNSLEAV